MRPHDRYVFDELLDWRDVVDLAAALRTLRERCLKLLVEVIGTWPRSPGVPGLPPWPTRRTLAHRIPTSKRSRLTECLTAQRVELLAQLGVLEAKLRVLRFELFHTESERLVPYGGGPQSNWLLPFVRAVTPGAHSRV